MKNATFPKRKNYFNSLMQDLYKNIYLPIIFHLIMFLTRKHLFDFLDGYKYIEKINV